MCQLTVQIINFVHFAHSLTFFHAAPQAQPSNHANLNNKKYILNILDPGNLRDDKASKLEAKCQIINTNESRRRTS